MKNFRRTFLKLLIIISKGENNEIKEKRFKSIDREFVE
jgi:hypothetical protein